MSRRRGTGRALPALVAALVLAWAAPAPAQPSSAGEAAGYVLVPAHAERLAALLAPLPLDDPFAGGCRIPTVALAHSVLRLTVLERDGAAHELSLAPPLGAAASPLRASPSFRADLAGRGAGAAWPPCAALVWHRIRSADDATFWDLGRAHLAAEAARAAAREVAAAPAPAEGSALDRLAAALALPFYRLVQLLWLLVAAWGLVCLARSGGPLRTLPRPELLALAGAVAAAVLLRALWAEPVVIHENYCGVGRLACADRPPCHSLTGNHSWASFAFYNLVLLLGGGATTAALLVNLVLMGVVHPLLVFALGRDLAGDARVGVLAAWALALLPPHIRMSPTESFFPADMAALLASVLAVRDLARHGGTARAALAAVLVALTVQTLRVYNLHAALAFGVLLLARPAWRRIGWRGAAVAVLTFAALTALHFREVLQAVDVGPGSYLPTGPLDFLEKLATNDLFLDPAYTPPVLALAWLLGAGALLWRRPREGATALLLLLGLGVVFWSADPNDVDWPTRLRMQVSLAPFVALLAGAGLALLLWPPAPRWRWPGRALAVALVLASVPFVPRQHALVREVLVPAREARFLADAIPRLPEAAVLVTVDREDRLPDARVTGDPVETHFPDHELRRHSEAHGWSPVERRSVSAVLADPTLVAGRPALFYQAANAHAWLPEELAVVGPTPGPRPALVELRRRFRLTPVGGLTGTLPACNPPSVRFRFPHDAIPVGFYRLEPR